MHAYTCIWIGLPKYAILWGLGLWHVHKLVKTPLHRSRPAPADDVDMGVCPANYCLFSCATDRIYCTGLFHCFIIYDNMVSMGV